MVFNKFAATQRVTLVKRVFGEGPLRNEKLSRN